jgi:hypothetical protein
VLLGIQINYQTPSIYKLSVTVNTVQRLKFKFKFRTDFVGGNFNLKTLSLLIPTKRYKGAKEPVRREKPKILTWIRIPLDNT